MENVLVNGFDDKRPTSDDSKVPVNIQVKLGDLGSVMRPSRGKITSITYRSPEVYLGKPWTSATDIWSWGIVLFHLIQARLDLNSPGIYDSPPLTDATMTLKQKEDTILSAMCHDFNLRSTDYFKDCDIPVTSSRTETTSETGTEIQGPDRDGDGDGEHWGDRLIARGVDQFDVVFLYAVLQPDPTERMTVSQILETQYLDVYKPE
ncbi:hypothetical protein FQN49_006006 [Arthroderma sp. PD_2]|nr:hypothetical protein FQN49_006006 [Arthroderma sp. PD_2]